MKEHEEILSRILKGYLAIYGYVSDEMVAAYQTTLKDFMPNEVHDAISQWVKSPTTGDIRFKPLDVLRIINEQRYKALEKPRCAFCHENEVFADNEFCFSCRVEITQCMHDFKIIFDYGVKNWKVKTEDERIIEYCKNAYKEKMVH